VLESWRNNGEFDESWIPVTLSEPGPGGKLQNSEKGVEPCLRCWDIGGVGVSVTR